MTKRLQENAEILANRRIQGDYFQIDMDAGAIVPEVGPGQFVHVQLPEFEHHILRRPFSIYNADVATGILSIIYKVVGEGTAHMSQLGPGGVLNLLGPLGNGYSVPSADTVPVIVAGGYGCAATYLLALACSRPCICLIGGRSKADLLLVDEFREAGCDVCVSTDDGSAGYHGVVTDLLEEILASEDSFSVAACGPNPMLHSVSRIALAKGIDAEISLDHVMCCGVGACFACVVKLRADNDDGWEYVRTCRSGPVFRASDVVWE